MIADLSLWQWLKFAGALILFFSPGVFWISRFPAKTRQPLSLRMVLAFGLSLGLWIILLIWLQLFNLSLNAWLTRLLFAAAFLLSLIQLYRQRQHILQWLRQKENLYEFGVLGFCLLVSLFYLYLYRHLLTGMGSDSMHHTLIADLLIDGGQIPKDYGPYAPVVSFSYHFGYHSLVAALSWLSGIAPRLIVILSGALLMGLVSLASAALTNPRAKHSLAGLPGIASAAIPGLIYIFPAYSLLWGRYTQLLGTLLLMIFILALIDWGERFARRAIPMLAILTTAFLFSHYRIFIAGGIFALLYLGLRKDLLAVLRQNLLRWISVPGGAFLLSLPWLVQLYLARQHGYPVGPTPTDASFFSLERLGTYFHSETQTTVLIALSLLGLLLGLLRKSRLALVLSVWLLLLGLFSQPNFLGVFMDPVTLLISSYAPIAICLGLLLEPLIGGLPNKQSLRTAALLLICLAAAAGLLSGVKRWRAIDLPANSFVTQADLHAAAWIQANTPAAARFMINTYQFPVSETLVIGLDGGYWLPALAQRSTVAPPMVYTIEKLSFPGAERQPVALHNLGGQLTAPQALELLRQSGVTYVYLGAKGGPIPAQSLLDSETYELVYQNKGAKVFRLR